MNIKSRYWSFIVYPESAPIGWESKLCEIGVVFAVSPLHNKDINPNGEKKKEHWHVLVEFEGPTTYKNVKENICDLVNGTIPVRVISLRGYYRYLTHADNPEKAQYDSRDVKEYGGFRLELTTTETTQLKIEIIEDINEYNFYEICDLTNYYLGKQDIDKIEYISNHTFFIDKYICSKRNKANREENEKQKYLAKHKIIL